ncbi:hypothetical protein, no similarity [Maudiozyma saulgeensis]|uniref:Spindle pole component 29 n=1 Tax=Maudiozyma saulgeensis TaxID=1789683 RepID=A0A1X7R978_9SACH|nr:hypothetical protein, no similarity [Kazachstania saulgeensis]
MHGEQDGSSSNVRDFFKRPENEDTLHYLKRQHQEQMKRMDELEASSSVVSPLKPTTNIYGGSNKPSGAAGAAATVKTANAGGTRPTVQERQQSAGIMPMPITSASTHGQSDLLRQQLRGELPLPSSAMSSSTSNGFSNRRSDNTYNYALYNNETRLPQQFIEKDFNSNSMYMKSIQRETESLRDIVYQQQRDMHTLNMLLDDERTKNINLYDRLSYLEKKIQMIELNTQIPIQRRTVSSSSSSAASSYGGRPFGYNNGYPPSSQDTDNNNINASRIYSNTNSNERAHQYRNQEFISSPTTNHPFSIVDDKTTNLLFSRKTTQ